MVRKVKLKAGGAIIYDTEIKAFKVMTCPSSELTKRV